MKNRKQGRKTRTREREREEERENEKGGGVKRNKRKHRRITTQMALVREKTGFFNEKQRQDSKKTPTKTKKIRRV